MSLPDLKLRQIGSLRRWALHRLSSGLLSSRRRSATQSRSAIESLEDRSLLAAGAGLLDPTFGTGGSVVTKMEDSAAWGNQARDVAVQADGKIVAVGDGMIVRYLPNGALDTTFGGGGRVAFTFSGSQPAIATSVAVQTNGRIVVAGYQFRTDQNTTDFTVARYLSNGALDTSFDVDGSVITPFGNSSVQARDVVIQANGRILVGGTGGSGFAIARYLSNGTLDTSFDGDGKKSSLGGSFVAGPVESVAVQSDGRILLAGNVRTGTPPSPFNSAFQVIRLNANGALDSTFDSDGIVTVKFAASGNSVEEARSITVQPSGQVVVSGSANLSSVNHLAIARLNSNGGLDTSFDTDGKVLVPQSANIRAETGSSVQVQSDGRVVSLAGGRLWRFNANGSPDLSFGGLGYVHLSGLSLSAAAQPDGKFLVSGQRNGLFGVARVTSSGILDPTFAVQGFAETQSGLSRDSASGSALQANGRIVVVGQSRQTFSVARYLSNGQLDSSFSQDGKAIFSLGNQYVEANASDVVIQPNGRIVLAGTVYESSGNSRISRIAVIRLMPGGTLDSTFSGDGIFVSTLGGLSAGRTLALQSDGRILVGGQGPTGTLTLMRLNVDGTLDSQFGTVGVATIATTTQSTFEDIAVLPSGAILAAGTQVLPGTGIYRSTMIVTKFLPTGVPDLTFGANGTVQASSSAQRTGTSIALLTGDRFLVAGTAHEIFETATPDVFDMAVTRFLANGTIDSSFGTVVHSTFRNDGINPFVPSKAVTSVSSMVVQPNGRIVIGGDNGSQMTLLRLNSDGTRDTSFDADGDSTRVTGLRPSLLQQTDGKLIAAGTVRSLFGPFLESESDFVIGRFNNPLESAFSTQVFVNAQGQIEVRDIWERNDQFNIHRSGMTGEIVIRDQSPDSHAKFQVIGLPTVVGHGTKEVRIPWTLVHSMTGQLSVRTLGGNDTIAISGAYDIMQGVNDMLRIDAGTGLDNLRYWLPAASVLWNITSAGTGTVGMQPGNPVTQFSNAEFLSGGTAIDTFEVATLASTMPLMFDGGLANDTLRMTDDSNMTLTNASLTVSRVTGSQTLFVKSLDHVDLTGGQGNNIIDTRSFSGRTTLSGRAGDDVLLGSIGSSLIYGHDGNDVLFGNLGIDTLDGGDDNDFLYGAEGDDILRGGTGRDILLGHTGADQLFGGEDDDVLIGGTSPIFTTGIDGRVPPTQLASWLDPYFTVWLSAATYGDRVIQLRDVGVINDDAVPVRLAPNESVFDDGSTDTLFGESGLDWFFAANSELGLPTTGVRDLELGEILSLFP